MNKKYYVTTAIDYTNDVIHIGHAYQKILADVLARYHRQIGDKTYFLTGTDEHGQKVESSAKEKGINPKDFVDKIAKEDKKQWDKLNISYDRFIRTTDADHVKFSQEFYLKAKANGDIYKAKYKGFYCEGCESFKEASELNEEKCEFHPTKKIQKIEEQNYFFALSKYQKFLLNHIKKHPEFIWPESRRNEILSFIKSGLKDFSISRQNVTWGISVPDDPTHTIYVWFDALINYLTYGDSMKCWPADIHILGKDNQRFHAIYWPAMLKSAGYKLPKTILVHDFISLDGQKVSKSLGNVILPSELIKKFGVDGVRYFFLRHGPLANDIDITLDKIQNVYNSDLANGLGNLVSRVAKLAEKSGLEFNSNNIYQYSDYPEIVNKLEEFRFDQAMKFIWEKITKVDQEINKTEPWKLEGKKLKKFLENTISSIQHITYNLKPFLPETAEKITKIFEGPKIKSSEPLFPRV
ncbi:MAG: methionine--tRNA ligase [Patescibacteria group bacterium]